MQRTLKVYVCLVGEGIDRVSASLRAHRTSRLRTDRRKRWSTDVAHVRSSLKINITNFIIFI